MVLLPELGGSVGSVAWHGRQMLRAASPGRTPSSPLETAAFPMVPFSGRIAYGRFRWDGLPVQLAANFPPEPHAIHGQGWRSAWSVREAGADRAVLEWEQSGCDWPWPFMARQSFLVEPDGIGLDLSIRNTGTSGMPAGLGWHPYFPAAGAVLQADVDAIWSPGPCGLPVLPGPMPPASDLRMAKAVTDLDLDTPFRAAKASARLGWPDAGVGIRMTSSPELGHLVVFTPPGEDFFCVEPASHVPNAHNLDLDGGPTGLVELAPGATFRAAIRLDFHPL